MESITKLQPNRTMELGFFSHPSCNAALHSTTATGWNLSGVFRRQNDYAIVEWNKHNRWDHPRLRYLPDGDLSGITLVYDEYRVNCQSLDSNAYAYTDWPDLLIWANTGGNEVLYRVPLRNYATLVSGSLTSAMAQFSIEGAVAAHDVITVCIMSEKYSYVVQATDTLSTIAERVAEAVNSGPEVRLCNAAATGNAVTLTARAPGRDGNAIGFQVRLWHLATKAQGRLTFSGTVQYEPPSRAESSVDAAAYAADVYSPEALDDLVFRLAAYMQADPKVDVAWQAGGIIKVTAKQAGTSGNAIVLAGAGTNGVTGTVAQPMAGGTNSGATVSLSVTPMSGMLAGGNSSATWRVSLNFGALLDRNYVSVQATDVRRIRWTYSPPLAQAAAVGASAIFTPVDFSVAVSNWTVTGTGTPLQVAGPLSRRIEDDSAQLAYNGGGWSVQTGNVSGETIRYTTTAGNSVVLSYSHPLTHSMYLGTQRTFDSAVVQVQIDGGTPFNIDLYAPGQYFSDIYLARERLAVDLPAGTHTVSVTHTGNRNPGSSGYFFYFDFLEIAVPSDVPGAPETRTDIGFATDYDTAALWLPPERLAWSIEKTGLKGEVNHFAGIEFFYEKTATGWQTALATVALGGTVTPGNRVTITIGSPGTAIYRDVAFGDTLESIAAGLAVSLNALSSVCAQAAGEMVIVGARVPGSSANGTAIGATTNEGASETVTLSGFALSGGEDGEWQVNAAAVPVLNRAARDWHRAFCAALLSRGMEMTIALSLELKHGAVAWAQKFADGTTVITGNGSIQTSPVIAASRAFWKACYAAFAAEMSAASMRPRLQFGETQWWYFAGGSPASMAYYDAETAAAFATAHGRPMVLFTAPDDDPSVNGYVDANFLRDQLGSFCDEVRATVLAAYPAALFETLWPRDMNDPAANPLNYHVNLPTAAWSPAQIATFKTEAFQESWPQRNMEKARETVCFPFTTLSFTRENSRHLLGSMASYPQDRQVQVALAERIGLVTLWAWDQFCAIGRELPVPRDYRRALFTGA